MDAPLGYIGTTFTTGTMSWRVDEDNQINFYLDDTYYAPSRWTWDDLTHHLSAKAFIVHNCPADAMPPEGL